MTAGNWLIDANLLYYPWGDSAWRPYASLGFGLTHFNFYDPYGHGYNTMLIGMPLGVGLKYYWTPAFIFRADLMDNLGFGGDINVVSNFSLTGGIEYRFGGAPQLLALESRPDDLVKTFGCATRLSAPRCRRRGSHLRPCARYVRLKGLAPGNRCRPAQTEALALQYRSVSQTTPTAEDVDGFADDDAIRIRGARVHNLRNVDLDIPRDRLVVITGPSGSGKSSLAFDTLYAEGQRQYIESLSVYARQFLHQMERPDVDLIEGLQPTISVDQRAGSQNPRSTVATVTEIYDYLRLLMARLGQPHCYQCGAPIRQQAPEQIVADLAALPVGTKAMIMAPLVRGRKGQHKDVFAAIRKAGFVRARVDGEVIDVDQTPELAPRKNHNIEAVVDRVVIRPGLEGRLAESVELAIRHGEGAVLVVHAPPGATAPAPSARTGGVWQESLFSTLGVCPNCKLSFEELEPRSFSFNSPYGACPQCEGLGWKTQFDPDLILPDAELSLATARLPLGQRRPAGQETTGRAGGVRRAGRRRSRPASRGMETQAAGTAARRRRQVIPGLLTLLEQQYVTATDAAKQERLEAFRGPVPCSACGGARLRPEARACTLSGKAIHEIAALPISAAKAWFAQLVFSDEDQLIARPLVTDIAKRLDFLDRVGVDYLTLDRPADTLSGGELQRVRLATAIGSGLVGVCYVLDEPSIGLHQRDNQRLIDALRNLQQQGNTVLVVEHDEAMMRSADRLVDIGPGAGMHGGRIVAQGTSAEVAADPLSITGQYLSGRLAIPVPPARRQAGQNPVDRAGRRDDQ